MTKRRVTQRKGKKLRKKWAVETARGIFGSRADGNEDGGEGRVVIKSNYN